MSVINKVLLFYSKRENTPESHSFINGMQEGEGKDGFQKKEINSGSSVINIFLTAA